MAGPVKAMFAPMPMMQQPVVAQPKKLVMQQKPLDPIKVAQAKQTLVARHVEAIIARIDKIFSDEFNYVADYGIQYGEDPEGTVTFKLPVKGMQDEKGNVHFEFSDTLLCGIRVRQFLKTNITRHLEAEKLTEAQRKFFDIVFKKLIETYNIQRTKYAPRLSHICTVENITNKDFSKSLLLQSITLELNSKVNPQLIELFK